MRRTGGLLGLTLGLALPASLAGCRPEAATLEAPRPALAGLDRAVRSYPDDADVRLRRARLLRGLGRLSEAALDETRAGELALTPRSAALARLGLLVARSPGTADPYLGLGKELWDAGQAEAAAEVWAEGTRHQPGSAALWRNLGLALYHRQDLAGAAAAYRRSAALDPDSLVARTDLAWALLGLGQHDEARRLCLEVLARDPADAAARAILARLPAAGSPAP